LSEIVWLAFPAAPVTLNSHVPATLAGASAATAAQAIISDTNKTAVDSFVRTVVFMNPLVK
jgi:hypothetical protein